MARWGARLAGALCVPHEAGLVHRDVKPTNVLFVQGEPCLGDYGLVGEPGAAIDFNGTEGYLPIEGSNDKAADLFALGKTLYEAWTAGDRLEFPSLSRSILDAPDWSTRGSRLNEVILRACHSHPRKRFRSAAELGTALLAVVSGQRTFNRRRWVFTSAGVVAVAACGVASISRLWRAPARVAWQRVRQEGFNVESWQGHAGTVDWSRRRMYSICVDTNGCVFQSIDLDRFTLTQKVIADGPRKEVSSILHPTTKQLWAIEGGRGKVFALDTESETMMRLGGGLDTLRHYFAKTYWNPITQRVGVFGGYGMFAVRNDRCEFDAATGQWIELEPDRRNTDLWPRNLQIPLTPDDTGRRIFVVGGSGSPSGKQGEMVRGLPAFTGQFHLLDDIWELNLETTRWRRLLPLGHLEPQWLRAAVYHPVLRGLVIFQGIRLLDAKVGAPKVLLFRPDVDRRPIELPMRGQPSRIANAWAWTLDPQNDDVLLFADDGIFRIAASAD